MVVDGVSAVLSCEFGWGRVSSGSVYVTYVVVVRVLLAVDRLGEVRLLVLLYRIAYIWGGVSTL